MQEGNTRFLKIEEQTAALAVLCSADMGSQLPETSQLAPQVQRNPRQASVIQWNSLQAHSTSAVHSNLSGMNRLEPCEHRFSSLTCSRKPSRRLEKIHLGIVDPNYINTGVFQRRSGTLLRMTSVFVFVSQASSSKVPTENKINFLLRWSRFCSRGIVYIYIALLCKDVAIHFARERCTMSLVPKRVIMQNLVLVFVMEIELGPPCPTLQKSTQLAYML